MPLILTGRTRLEDLYMSGSITVVSKLTKHHGSVGKKFIREKCLWLTSCLGLHQSRLLRVAAFYRILLLIK